MNEVGVSFEYRAGESVHLRFTARNADQEVADITGSTPIFVMGRRVGSEPVASTEETPATAAAALVEPSVGAYDVTINPAVTAALSGTYRFESWLEDSAGGRSNPAHGYLTFERSLIEE